MKQRTVNTQSKLYDVACDDCGCSQEILDILRPTYSLHCKVCNNNTPHSVVVNGGTGYRWRWADLDGRPEVKIGDPW